MDLAERMGHMDGAGLIIEAYCTNIFIYYKDLGPPNLVYKDLRNASSSLRFAIHSLNFMISQNAFDFPSLDAEKFKKMEKFYNNKVDHSDENGDNQQDIQTNLVGVYRYILESLDKILDYLQAILEEIGVEGFEATVKVKYLSNWNRIQDLVISLKGKIQFLVKDIVEVRNVSEKGRESPIALEDEEQIAFEDMPEILDLREAALIGVMKRALRRVL